MAVREMVLREAGDDVGEYLPASEIENSVELWEGTLLTIDHPRIGNRFVNAKRRDIQEKHGSGQFFNPRFENRNSLAGEMWIDLTRVEDVDGLQAAVDVVLDPESPGLEVSTAYLAFREAAEGEFDGVAYNGIQRGLIPEHLALLPHGKGKCSVEDGCGTPRRNESATEPTEEDTVPEPTQKKGLVQSAIAFLSRAFEGMDQGVLSANADMSDGDRRQLLQTALRETFAQNDDWLWVAAVFEDRVVYELENEGFFQVTYTIDEETGAVELTDEPVEVRQVTTFEPVSNSQEEPEMKRKTIIERLANAETVPFCKKELEAFDDARLNKLNSLLPEEEAPAGGDASATTDQEPATPPAAAAAGDEGEGGPEAAAPQQNALSEQETAQVRALLQNSAKDAETRKERHAELVRDLAANEACQLPEAKLNAMDLETLEGLSESFADRFYIGRGGPRSNATGEGERYVDTHPSTPSLSEHLRTKRNGQDR